jgi:hypothetical protein
LTQRTPLSWPRHFSLSPIWLKTPHCCHYSFSFYLYTQYTSYIKTPSTHLSPRGSN